MPGRQQRRLVSRKSKGTFVFLLAILPLASTEVSKGDPIWAIRHVLPKLNLKNISVVDVRFNVGDTAFLPCHFPHYTRHHENGVSWIRRWDWQILSAGLYTYTNDDRFAVLHKDGSDDWSLQIKYLRPGDNGTYECQIHTGGGFLSQFVNLHVIRPKAVILGAVEIHVHTGQRFVLTCVIEKAISPPVYVMWSHRDRPVNYAPDRPRLAVHTLPKGVHTSSTLVVVDAQYSDSGNYTCTSPSAEPAYVTVYVTEGDTVAAVQRRGLNNDSNSGSAKPYASHCSGLVLLILLLTFCTHAEMTNVTRLPFTGIRRSR